MKKFYPEGEPRQGSKAGIINWDTTLYFLTKEQRDKFVKKLMKEDIDFNFSCDTCYVDTGIVYTVEIEEMPWANNLSAVAEIAESLDYNTGEING